MGSETFEEGVEEVFDLEDNVPAAWGLSASLVDGGA